MGTLVYFPETNFPDYTRTETSHVHDLLRAGHEVHAFQGYAPFKEYFINLKGSGETPPTIDAVVMPQTMRDVSDYRTMILRLQGNELFQDHFRGTPKVVYSYYKSDEHTDWEALNTKLRQELAEVLKSDADLRNLARTEELTEKLHGLTHRVLSNRLTELQRGDVGPVLHVHINPSFGSRVGEALSKLDVKPDPSTTRRATIYGTQAAYCLSL